VQCNLLPKRACDATKSLERNLNLTPGRHWEADDERGGPPPLSDSEERAQGESLGHGEMSGGKRCEQDGKYDEEWLMIAGNQSSASAAC